MTRLDKTEGKRVDGTRIGLAPLKLAAALGLSALVACAPEAIVSNDDSSASSNAMKETVGVRWTEHGIPHITAQTW